MSVLLEAISVVVRVRTLEEKYPGGLAGYQADCPNQTFCADEHLSRVGFMAPPDVGDFVRYLERIGLVPFKDYASQDVVVMDEFQGPTTPCDWIECGRHPDGFSVAWLKGTEPGELFAPVGWTIGQSQSLQFIANEDVEDRLLQVAEEDGLTTAIDLNTGRETFIARVRRRLLG